MVTYKARVPCSVFHQFSHQLLSQQPTLHLTILQCLLIAMRLTFHCLIMIGLTTMMSLLNIGGSVRSITLMAGHLLMVITMAVPCAEMSGTGPLFLVVLIGLADMKQLGVFHSDLWDDCFDDLGLSDYILASKVLAHKKLCRLDMDKSLRAFLEQGTRQRMECPRYCKPLLLLKMRG